MTPEQLKASILQYAIQGKLVEQRPEEGTAQELYQQIKDEKQRLVKEGKIKKEKPLAEITEDEIPFDIPERWKWVRFGEFGSYKKGPFGSALTKSMFVSKGENTIKVYEQKNAIQKDASLGDYYISQEYFIEKMSGFEVSSGDVIVSCAGTIGETYIMPEKIEKGIINQALMRMKLMPSVYKPYFLLFFDVVLKKNAQKSSKGSAIKNIPPFDELKSYLVPLPPLEEQHRIVAKIEELLPFVDRYAKAYEKLEQFNAKFPEDMKKSILQYAIQGKLVEQRPEEGTAEELYQQIQEEKQRLIKEGKIKKEKPLAEISENEIPFDIPESWKWVKLGDFTSYAQTKEKISPTEITKDMWSLDLEDIQKETGDILVKTKALERKISGDKVKFYKGQVLYSKLRPYLKKILVAPDSGICTPELVPFNTYLVDEEYLVNVLKSPHVDYVINSVTYGVKMPRVGTDTMINLLIPLPPLKEQKRIVSKIKELMPYCDRLVK